MTTAPANADPSGGAGGLKATLAAYFEPRLIAVLFMGFSSGLPLALTGGTLQVWQTRGGVSLATIGFFVLVGVAYNLKFLWAPFMDRVALPGFLGRLGRRRGWAVLTQSALMLAILGLGAGDPVAAPMLTAAFAVLVAFCSASQDIVIDAYRIELLDQRQQGAGAAMTQYGYRLGMLASGAGALFLADAVSWFWVYAMMAALVLVGIVTVLLTREPKPAAAPLAAVTDARLRLMQTAALLGLAGCAVAVFLAISIVILGDAGWPKWAVNSLATLAAAGTPVLILRLLPRGADSRPGSLAHAYADLRRWLGQSVLQPFADLGRRSGWVHILAFIVLFKLGDAVAGTMANPFYVQMGFSNAEIASISKVFGLIATLIGVFLGGLIVVRLGIVRGLLIGGILQMFSNLMFAAQSLAGHDMTFLAATIGIENLSGGMGSAAFVAYLSALCSVAFTGTQYALFSSLAAVGRTVLSSPGGLLAEDIGWFNYFLLSTAAALPGLAMLLWLMRRYPAVGMTTGGGNNGGDRKAAG